jgi:prevent-host-death family protein
MRTSDIHSLTDFTRNAKGFIKHIRATKRPMAITVNGEAEVVIQDAASYQEMVDEIELSRLVGAVLEGERAIADGRIQDAGDAFDEIRVDLGLPR